MKYFILLPVLLAGRLLLPLATAVKAIAATGFDTSYTVISFNYVKRTQFHTKYGNGSIVSTCTGKSVHAPMLTDGNGAVTVFCSDRAGSADVQSLPAMGGGIGMAAGAGVQAAFGIMAAQDHSMHGAAHYESSGDGVKTIAILGQAFSFRYDPGYGLSIVSVGAQLKIEITTTQDGQTTVSHETMGIGMSAGSDPAAVYGVSSNPNETYATFTKTKSGYRVVYTKTTHNEEDGPGVSTTETLDASVGEETKPYEAVIKAYACDYEHWLPRGPKTDGSDNTKGDNNLRFNIIVQKKGDPSSPYSGQYTVKWNLDGVTHYPGICNNYPAYSTSPDAGADLVFDPALQQSGPFASVSEASVSTKKGAGNGSAVAIMCKDYAAWGRLTASVTLDDGTTIDARPYYRSEDSAWLTIPYDRDENKLADAWEKKTGVYGKDNKLTDDKDEQNDQLDAGDGYTVFEEYRGFAVNDNALYKPANVSFIEGHVRTDPAVKDAFIYDKDGLFKKYYNDVNPAQINWHYVDPDQHQLIFNGEDHFEPEHRWVNFNKVDDYFYGRQYAMFLEKGIYSYDPKAAGITWAKSEYDFSNDLHRNQVAKDKMHQASAAEANISPAQRYFKCVIYLGKIKDASSGILGLTDRGGPDANRALYNKVIEVQTAIAVLHEIGHYLGISHHHTTTSICNNENTDLCNVFNNPTQDGAYGCLMRYPSLGQSFDTDFLSTYFTRYCKKGETASDYTYKHIYKADGTIERYASDNMAKFTTSATPVTCRDNCWGQVTVKTVPANK